MNPFTTPDRIFVSNKPQDMRCGIQRLASVVVTDFGADPADGALYCFVSRDCQKLKMLRFEVNGWCMYYCRLSAGCFKWEHNVRANEPVLRIERRELLWLLEGLTLHQNVCAPVTANKIL